VSDTISFESLLLHPDFPRMTAEARRAIPPQVLAEIDRASAGTHRGMTVIGAATGAGVSYPATAEIPRWLRLSVIETLLSFGQGRTSTCLHNPSAQTLAPVVAAAWHPGLVTCPRCVYLLRTPKGTDRCCDDCGRDCTDAGGVFPGLTQYGRLLFMFATCGTCRLDQGHAA
jgi:hypothetical protein